MQSQVGGIPHKGLSFNAHISYSSKTSIAFSANPPTLGVEKGAYTVTPQNRDLACGLVVDWVGWSFGNEEEFRQAFYLNGKEVSEKKYFAKKKELGY